MRKSERPAAPALGRDPLEDSRIDRLEAGRQARGGLSTFASTICECAITRRGWRGRSGLS